MIKAGLIVGAVAALFTAIFGSVISPYCGICAGIFAGLAAGYLAGMFQKPALSPEATKLGASAGAIAGGVSILGSLIAAVVNGLMLDPADMAAMAEALGVTMQYDQATIWGGQIFSACCVGLLNVGIGAGLGAAGGAIWYKMTGSKLQQPPAQQPPLVPPAY